MEEKLRGTFAGQGLSVAYDRIPTVSTNGRAGLRGVEDKVISLLAGDAVVDGSFANQAVVEAL